MAPAFVKFKYDEIKKKTNFLLRHKENVYDRFCLLKVLDE